MLWRLSTYVLRVCMEREFPEYYKENVAENGIFDHHVKEDRIRFGINAAKV